MARRVAWGDLAVAAGFALMGLVWLREAGGLDMWNRETPGPGFLVAAFGGLLLALAAIAAVQALVTPAAPPEGDGSLRKPLLVLAATLGGVLGLEVAGFALSVFLMLLALFTLAERKKPLPSLLAAAGVAAALHFIFAVWLAVPLPMGPFGD
jgi:putative tricarboxylic transport membrane protein